MRKKTKRTTPNFSSLQTGYHKIEVEEARTTPPPEEPQAGNCFYFDICGAEPESPITQGKPLCICHLLAILKSFSLA
jgi:hypothetical protein